MKNALILVESQKILVVRQVFFIISLLSTISTFFYARTISKSRRQ